MPLFIPGDRRKNVPGDLINIEKKVREELAKADSNKDGHYTRDELKTALKNMGAYIPGWRAKRCLLKADANGDGQIGEEEIDTLVDYLLSRGYGKN